MKWLFTASETATGTKVEFCLGLSGGPYKEAIFSKISEHGAHKSRFVTRL